MPTSDWRRIASSTATVSSLRPASSRRAGTSRMASTLPSALRASDSASRLSPWKPQDGEVVEHVGDIGVIDPAGLLEHGNGPAVLPLRPRVVAGLLATAGARIQENADV